MKYGTVLKSSFAIALGIGLIHANAYAQGETTLSQAQTQNKQSGADFLAANKKKAGVVTLPDGLQYRVLIAGKGPRPTIDDTVTVNYAGTLVDGMEFDSSYKRGE